MDRDEDIAEERLAGDLGKQKRAKGLGAEEVDVVEWTGTRNSRSRDLSLGPLALSMPERKRKMHPSMHLHAGRLQC